MSLILRVDVDKPYGNSNLFTKIMSKASEDYWFPPVHSIYLYHLEEFLEYCNSERISGFIYHRICTAPNEKIIKLLIQGNHKLGMHAENTLNDATFYAELNKLKKLCPTLNIESFSKHGSGKLKLGKSHYPPYEPEKYFNWSQKFHLQFYFGNGIPKCEQDLNPIGSFYPNVFWVERDYRDDHFSSIEKIIEIADNKDIPILIHPCNYHACRQVQDDFKYLIKLAKENNISWKVY